MGSLDTCFKTIPELSRSERESLADLYLRYYDGTTAGNFQADLDKKTEILLLRCSGVIVGFTTLELYERSVDGNKVRILYSGDTVVDRPYWGQQGLATAWIGRLARLKREQPTLPLYWFVIVKGHRTFKFLPTFGKSFYPHWSIDRTDLKPLADRLALEKFGRDYDPDRGIVAFPFSRGHLKPDIAFPTPEEAGRDAVRFFLERNPGYLKGHELVCLCEIAESNMRPLTRRLFAKGAA